MKKICLCFVSLLLICIFAFGCTYADHAKLVEIKAKYDNIANSEKYSGSLFSGRNFLPVYSSDKLNAAINRTEEQLSDQARTFTLLKASSVLNDYSSCSNYGLLYYAVNSIYINNYATLTSVANESKVPQKFKTELYKSLDRLSAKINVLKNKKDALESVFEDEGLDYQVITESTLAQTSLNEYIDSLNNVLLEFLDFNNIAKDALNKISPRNDVASQTTNTVTKNDINFLIVNSVLLISDYIVRFDIHTRNNFIDSNYDDTLINTLKNLLNCSNYNFSDLVNENIYYEYKCIYVQESAVLNKEKLFHSAIVNLNEEDFSASTLSKSKQDNIKSVESYNLELSNYCNNLLEFLTNLTK